MGVVRNCLAGRAVILVVSLLLSAITASGEADETDVSIYAFWQEGCPHCSRAKSTLTEIEEEREDIALIFIELGVSEENDELFAETIRVLNAKQVAVPFVVIGGDYEIGFSRGGITTTRYRKMIDRCQDVPCLDLVGALIDDLPVSESDPIGLPPAHDPDRLVLPLIGEVDLGALSLPLLTVVLAGVDGFNPCAMWVLALLIGLLLGVRDAKRMWILGAVFLAATGAMYFAVMAAWLNVVLWLGALGWLRLFIGTLAIGAGAYYLREYWTNPEGVCRVTPSGQRKRISDAFKAMVEQPNLAIATLGVAALAIIVNLVELACSAGLPAIYTQSLAMYDLTKGAYYGYLLLYLSVFLLDDTVIFVTAMVTLRAAVVSGRFSRLSHLIGGVVLLALGAVMVLRPDLLS